LKTLLSGLLRPVLLLAALAFGPAAVQPAAAQGGLQPIPAYDSPVVDTAGLLQPDERARLVARLMDLQTRTVRFVDTIHMFSRTPLREIRL
jgi:uncharacterized membrane protein YgcG